MSKFKVGTKVLLKKRLAKWYLDHPEIYTNGLTWDKDYEEETLLHLICCMGVPLTGIIICPASMKNTWMVNFKCSGLTMSYVVENKDLECLRL